VGNSLYVPLHIVQAFMSFFRHALQRFKPSFSWASTLPFRAMPFRGLSTQMKEISKSEPRDFGNVKSRLVHDLKQDIVYFSKKPGPETEQFLSSNRAKWEVEEEEISSFVVIKYVKNDLKVEIRVPAMNPDDAEEQTPEQEKEDEEDEDDKPDAISEKLVDSNTEEDDEEERRVSYPLRISLTRKDDTTIKLTGFTKGLDDFQLELIGYPLKKATTEKSDEGDDEETPFHLLSDEAQDRIYDVLEGVGINPSIAAVVHDVVRIENERRHVAILERVISFFS